MARRSDGGVERVRGREENGRGTVEETLRLGGRLPLLDETPGRGNERFIQELDGLVESEDGLGRSGMQ